MNWTMTMFPLMEEAPAPAGENGGGAAPAEAPKDEPKTILDGGDAPKAEDTPKEAPAEAPKEEPKKDAPAEAQENLLEDDAPAASAEAANAEAAQPTEEQLKAFTDGITAIDLGEGVKYDDAALRAVTPALIGLSGGDPKKAEGLVKAYVEHQRAVAREVAERRDAFNRGLINQCKERFGDDLQKVVRYAKEGGRAIFGDAIWKEMKKVTSFSNNPDIVEKLAEWGRRFATDGGKTEPDAPRGGERGDVLHRMYGNLKV